VRELDRLDDVLVLQVQLLLAGDRVPNLGVDVMISILNFSQMFGQRQFFLNIFLKILENRNTGPCGHVKIAK
jgi:hypothetical protein